MKEITIVVNDNEYSFTGIRKRTIHAPVDNVSISRLLLAKAHGKKLVDDSDIRICKINNITHLITGYNKVKEFIEQYSPDTKPVISVSSKIMSVSYLRDTMIVPVVKEVEVKVDPVIKKVKVEKSNSNLTVSSPVARPTKDNIADKLKSAGYKVR